MNEKLENVIKFLQSKAVGISVAEINSICQVIESVMKEPEEKKNEKKS